MKLRGKKYKINRKKIASRSNFFPNLDLKLNCVRVTPTQPNQLDQPLKKYIKMKLRKKKE